MSAPSQARVIEALTPIKDPELNIGIVDLGLVREVEVDAETGEVTVGLTLTSPMCPMGPQIMDAVKSAVQRIEGVTRAGVDLVWSPPWDPRVDASEDAKAELGIWD
jgi:metal-sulfur cluster biosynthetic enzyme